MKISWLQKLLSRNAEPIRVCIRQSPDWRGSSREELLENSRAFCRMVGTATGLHENFISDVVGVWDRTFPIPFFEVRAVMKDIAQANLQCVLDAQRLSVEKAKITPIGSQSLYFFIDDDDWLHPDVWRRLSPHVDTETDGYIFGNILCVSHIELRPVENGCYTNNYAVAADFLRRNQNAVERVDQHWDAHQVFHQPDFRRAQLPLYLSATNKHPASAMKLKDGLENNELSSSRLRQLVQKYVDESAAANVPAEAEWVVPYWQRTRKLFAGLLTG
jgi:hypothetical protein